MRAFVTEETSSLEEIYEDSVRYADLLVEHKGIVFKGLSPHFMEQIRIMELLYQGDDTNPREGTIFDEDHRILYKGNELNGIPFVDGMTPEGSKHNWHSDFPFSPEPPSLTSMHMKKFDVPKGAGRTWLLDLEMFYHLLPDDLKEWLEGDIYFDHRTGNYSDPAGRDNTGKHDVNGPTDNHFGEEAGSYHRALRTHPISKRTSVFFSGISVTLANFENPNIPYTPQGTPDDSQFKKLWEFMGYDVMKAFDPDHPCLYAREWEEGDLFIWDNRNLMHTFEGGWALGSRIFDKVEYGHEKPYYGSPN